MRFLFTALVIGTLSIGFGAFASPAQAAPCNWLGWHAGVSGVLTAQDGCSGITVWAGNCPTDQVLADGTVTVYAGSCMSSPTLLP
ncbi:MAG: hypothetical protein ACYDDF_06845 [Thermoplasmatota archaeon]